MYPSLILAISNIFGLPCLSKAINNKDTNSIIIVFTIMFSSFLMHLTESKHNYTPVIFKEYSNMFLWIDRISAIIGIIHFFFKYWNKDRNTKRIINILGIIGLSCSYLGERTIGDKFFNCIIYPFLHLIWHACVYTGINILI